MDPQTEHSTPHRFWLAILGFVVMLSSAFVWPLFFNNSFLRGTAIPLWMTLVVGVLIGVIAARQDRRMRTRVMAGFNGVFLLIAIAGFFVFSKLPVEANADPLPDAVPAFNLPNQEGEATSLQLAADEHALLVFYRGHW